MKTATVLYSAFLASSLFAQAYDTVFTGGSGANYNWNDPANWSNGVPSESSKVLIELQDLSNNNLVISGVAVVDELVWNVTGEMVHNEELSWNKLIRVLTHEIMNTVTPIASLSHTLSQELDSETSARSLDWKELKLGLDTIASSSDGLIKFVNTYRSLTRVSAPVKKAFFVRELIEKVQQLTRESLHQAGAVCSYVEKSEDILLYADADQLSQVLVNLVKNALQAEATKIEITAEIDYAETVVITVSNNGRPISAESQEEIFVPFYTTKPEGTGIGLSLSRQIMRLHNGTLTLGRSDKRMTTFILHFR